MQTHRNRAVLDLVFLFFFFPLSLLSTDVIVFLMVLEVITPCNVTRRLALSSKPQHGSTEVPNTHTHTDTPFPAINDSISQNASAMASCVRI